MFRFIRLLTVFALLIGPAAFAQETPQDPPAKDNPVAMLRDPELEKKSDHNVEVAEFYFKKRKSYKAAIERLIEVVEIYPQYSHADKALFLLGRAHQELGQADEAKERFKQLIKDHPDSDFAKQAKKELDKLK